MSFGRSSDTVRTASGRQVRRPKESEVVDILSRYANDSDDGDDSEDEDYTARSSYSTDRQCDSSKSGESDGEDDVIVQTKDSKVSRGGGPTEEEETGGEVESGSRVEQVLQHSPAPTAPRSTSTSVGSGKAQSLAQSQEMVAPLMMGFGQTRSGRTVVPSENFDILYLATKFGINPYESDESNDEDFKAKGKDNTLESLSDASTEIGEADDGEMEKSIESKDLKVNQEGGLPVVEADQEDMDTEDAFVPASDDEDESVEDKQVPMQACSVCLQESPSVDVVICDRCGWMTHEDCYGIAPLDGVEETEDGEEVPWFCDSCKMGVQPHCELCPNTGGLFKQVVNGKWAHIVCCLYTPGVTFIEPSQLNCVVLDEILPLRWGQKACQLCSDPSMAKTGVCVQCDVGMCRSAFHVTCAQKNGLLCETDISEEELSRKDSVMDAYFAHCKMHSKKATVHRKARLWSAVANQQQAFTFDAANVQTAAALARMGEVYRKEWERLVSSFYRPAHVDLVQERFLHTCPQAVKLFARKAQQMGLPPPGRPAVTTALTPKPSLSLEFVQHYKDCCRNMQSMVDTFPSLVRAVGELDVTQRELLERKSAGMLRQRQLEEEWGNLLCAATDLYTQWGVPVPAHLAKRERRKDSKEAEGTGCCVCYLSTRKHLMVQCNECRKLYHIDCLDPPLDTVPKKMKHYAWQCQECCCSEEEMLKPMLAQEEDRTSKRGRKILKPKYYGSP